MFGKILVPLDGSAFAETALPWALAVSRKAGSTVELVSVIEEESAYVDLAWRDAAADWSASYLEKTAAELRPRAGGELTTRLLEGRVWEAVVERAAAGEAGLIVMATHGRGAVSRAWLGSVADAVVRHTEQPVLLIRPEEEVPRSPAAEDVSVGTVLIPLDGSELSHAAVEPALELGSLFGARYRLLRVVAVPAESPSPYVPLATPASVDLIESVRRGAVDGVEKAASEMRARGVEVEAEVVVDVRPAHVILERAKERGALIALATHGRGGLSRVVLGSTADKVVRGAHGPVLVVRPNVPIRGR